VRNPRGTRALAILICLALLVWCTAVTPSAAHVDLAFPTLVFCFFVVIRLSLLPVSDGGAAVQPFSLLSVRISRAPPVA